MLTFENKHYILTLGEDCAAKSLIHKATGEECLGGLGNVPFFSLTEERPYNNEIKLAHPNKRTTFGANRVRREGDRLIVGFELVTFEAIVDVKIADDYIAFSLADFIIRPDDFGTLTMSPPPVCEFRIAQLPVKPMPRFGEWLNVLMNDRVAVNLLATSPFTKIDSVKRDHDRILTADTLRDVKLKNVGAALIVTAPDRLLDCIEQIEVDHDLPRGVESRRSGKLNASAFWTECLCPANVDEHIYWLKKSGLRMLLVYYKAVFCELVYYNKTSEYTFNERYPNGMDDLKAVLKKLHDAGITVGFHVLHTHIGINTHFVSPRADHRLNLTRHFTLAKPLNETDDIVYVEQNPEGAVMHPKCRVLQFGGELISYEAYTTEPPYRFTGCTRGHFDTTAIPHELGQIGGILDLSEFTATSVYLDQRTGLQDEIADEIAEIYDAGFSYVYYDGSEGVQPPFEIYVPYAQYRVYRKLKTKPLYCEGAAKAHFSWHMLSGGNAFDVFPMEIFKEKLAEHPLAEAPRMANDFTRLNFGWWKYDNDTQPDIYEYGTSKAASWDCPATIQIPWDGGFAKIQANPRTDDIMEVMSRWEDVRATGWLTAEQKAALQDPKQEYILLVNETGAYELQPYYPIKNVAQGNTRVSAFVFERAGKSYVVCWDKQGESRLTLPLTVPATYEVQLGGEAAEITVGANGTTLALSGRRYFSANLSKDELIAAFEAATLAN